MPERDCEAQKEEGDDEEEEEKPISVKRRMNALSLNFLQVALYLAFGGGVIMAIELPLEKEARQAAWDSLGEVLLPNGTRLNAPEVEIFRGQLEEAGACSFKDPASGLDYDFDFTGSIFFALTAVTTIGYGNFVPVSTGGQLFTALYSLVGISLILNFMFQVCYLWVMIVRGVMQRFCGVSVKSGPTVISNITFQKVNKSGSGLVDAKELRAVLQRLSGTSEPLDESLVAYAMWKADRNKTGRLDQTGLLNAVSVFLQVWPGIPKGVDASVLGVATIVITIWIAMWGSAIGSEEDWTFAESLWFGFVTLTTIGFGDKAPETHVGRIMAFMFIFVGLGMVAWFVSSLYEVWKKFIFWKMQRMYEKGQISDKWMDTRGYSFKSPLGIPRRMRIGPFVATQRPRTPTLSSTYINLINSEHPGEPKAQSGKHAANNGSIDESEVEMERRRKSSYQPLKDEDIRPPAARKKPASPGVKDASPGKEKKDKEKEKKDKETKDKVKSKDTDKANKDKDADKANKAKDADKEKEEKGEKTKEKDEAVKSAESPLTPPSPGKARSVTKKAPAKKVRSPSQSADSDKQGKDDDV